MGNSEKSTFIEKPTFSEKTILTVENIQAFYGEKNVLQDINLSFTEKSYIIASQKYMFKDVEGCGKVSMTNA